MSLTNITSRLAAAHTERDRHPVGTPAWWDADKNVAAVCVDLSAYKKAVYGR